MLTTNTPEYLPFRCCMCPNGNADKAEHTICPAISNTNATIMNKPETPCRFVKGYIDEKGHKYKVMAGISTPPTYKARYQNAGKKGSVRWKGYTAVSWRDSFDQAQADLNQKAKEKGWREWEEAQ